MKIWLLTTETVDDTPGGIARYADTFGRLLARRGHEVRVLCKARVSADRRSEGGCAELEPGYTVDRYVTRAVLFDGKKVTGDPQVDPCFPFNVLAHPVADAYQCAEEVLQRIEEFGAPDVIECQDFHALGYFLLQRKWIEPGFLSEIPIIVHAHTPHYMVDALNGEMRYRLPDYWIGQLEKACFHLADSVICPSRHMQEALEEEFEAHAMRLVQIPHAVMERAVEPTDFRDSKTLLYFGRIEWRKGLDPLLRACDRLWRDGQDFRLNLIGQDTENGLCAGSVKEFFKERYRGWVEEDRLVFEPSLAHEAMLERLRLAGGVVIPSLWENYPNVCHEAMQAGQCILASRSGGQAEMLGEDDPAGILFDHEHREGDLRRALLEWLGMKTEERRELGSRAIRRIAEIGNADQILARRIRHFEELRGSTPRTAEGCFPFTDRRLREGPRAPRPSIGEGPRLSVVIPHYNLGQYLEEAVESVLASDLEDLEVLIVDDGSTSPESRLVVDAFERHEDARVRVIRRENMGLAMTRNYGAEQARAPYVAFVDADDAVSPGFFSRCLEILDYYANVHLCYSWVKYFDDKEGVWMSWNTDLPYMLAHNLLIPICVVRRASFLRWGKNDPDMVFGLEDFEGWISMLEAGCGGIAIPEALVRYRVRSASMFRQINWYRQLYLYDVIVRNHPGLYREYGAELFGLICTNGPAHTWDQPTCWETPIANLYARARQTPEELRIELREAIRARDMIWHQKQREVEAKLHFEGRVRELEAELERLKDLPAEGS